MQKILDHLDKEGVIDDDDVCYNPSNFPFTKDEFRAFTEEIWKKAGMWDDCEEYVVEDAHFETYCIPFKENDKQYYLSVMYGQGSAWTVFTEQRYKEYQERIAEESKDDPPRKREISEEKAIDTLRFALSVIQRECVNNPILEQIAIEALDITKNHARISKVSTDNGLESWLEFKKRKKL